MNKYLVQYIEVNTIEVEAEDKAQAEVKAFESDAWIKIVQDYTVTTVSTSDQREIFDLFELDDLNDTRGYN